MLAVAVYLAPLFYFIEQFHDSGNCGVERLAAAHVVGNFGDGL